ncbi:MAG: biopolymer transport protein ExbD [Flavobacteriales bacterium]|jgi:biopolymer transport protein ExbD
MELRSRNKVEASFSMSSMTDLVFLLLIFFIIVSTLVSPYALPVNLPKSANKSSINPTVSVTIKKDLTHYVGSKRINAASLERQLLSQFDANETDKKVVLHVDESVPTGVTINVIDIAKRNNCKVVLATKAK